MLDAAHTLFVLLILLSVEHVAIALFEALAWTSDAARKASGLSKDVAEATRALGVNQGLYNGIFAVGFAWAAFSVNASDYTTIVRVFGTLLLIVGVYGAKAFSRNIFYVQALPAMLILALSAVV